MQTSASKIKLCIKEIVQQFAFMSVLFFIATFLLRIFSFFQIKSQVIIDLPFFEYMVGYIYDTLMITLICSIIMVPFIIGYCLSKKVTKTVFSVLIMLYTITNIILIEYLCIMQTPLDQIVYTYSIEETGNIITSSVKIQFGTIIFTLVSLGSSLALCIMAFKKRAWFGIKTSCVIVLAILLCNFINRNCIIESEKFYNTHINFLFSTNQQAYAYNKISTYKKSLRKDNITNSDIMSAIKTHSLLFPQQTYTNINYPFTRLANDPDVLGSFITKTSDSLPPNIVFLIIEGFGRNLTGIDESTISFTPFIDSLATNGLFWPNCVSTAERTFGVLPAIMISAPYGEHAFGNKWNPFPRHNSILKDFSLNGYKTSFFSGGSSSFREQNDLLIANKVEYIMQPQLDTASANYKELSEHHRWGLDDAETFAQAINYKKSSTHRPFIDIYLTLTTHEPFKCPNESYYYNMVDEMVEKHNFKNKVEKERIVKNKNIFACFLYTDNCVRNLIAEYKKLGLLNNTLFVICGDHRMCPLNNGNPIRKYHIPLIIYSPLIKEPREMRGVVSHLDIAPSINSYLKNNYAYKTSNECQWVGQSFDTTTQFRCNKKHLFMLNNRDIVEFLCDTFYIADNRLFRVYDNLVTKQIENDSLLTKMKSLLESEKLLYKHVVQHDYLTPTQTHQSPINTQKYDFDKNTLLNVETKEINENKVGYVAKTTEFTPLCKYFNIDKKYYDIQLDIKFDYKYVSNSQKPSLFIFTIKNNNEHIIYHKVPIAPSNIKSDSTMNTFVHRGILMLNNRDIANCKTEIYIWNNTKNELIFDNVSVEIQGITNNK